MTRLKYIWSRGKAFTVFILLMMALMRLIWIQLRDYPPAVTPRNAIAIESLPLHSFQECKVRHLTEDDQDYIFDVLLAEQREWLLSPGFAYLVNESCKSKKLSFNEFVTINRNIFSLIIFIAALASRFLAGGWMMSLITAVALLSRGRMITSIGSVSSELLTALCISAFFLFLIHFVRTGSKISMIFTIACNLAAGICEPSLYLICIGIPLIIISWRSVLLAPTAHIRDENIESDTSISSFIIWRKLSSRLGMHRFSKFYRGSEKESVRFVAPLTLPISTWILFERRWIVYTLLASIGSIIVLVLGTKISGIIQIIEGIRPDEFMTGVHRATIYLWLNEVYSTIDIDLICSLITISIGAFSPKDKCLPGYSDVCNVTLLIFSITILGSLSLDFLDLIFLKSMNYQLNWMDDNRATKIFAWFEPIFITIGIVGILNIINLFNAFLAKK